tara:strand:+ start:1883 stop:2131 length:249 start_codon:yes stop_codon:yes gene_type:complete
MARSGLYINDIPLSTSKNLRLRHRYRFSFVAIANAKTHQSAGSIQLKDFHRKAKNCATFARFNLNAWNMPSDTTFITACGVD